METAYTSTIIRYYQAASMFREFLPRLDFLDDRGNQHCWVDCFPVAGADCCESLRFDIFVSAVSLKTLREELLRRFLTMMTTFVKDFFAMSCTSKIGVDGCRHRHYPAHHEQGDERVRDQYECVVSASTDNFAPPPTSHLCIAARYIRRYIHKRPEVAGWASLV